MSKINGIALRLDAWLDLSIKLRSLKTKEKELCPTTEPYVTCIKDHNKIEKCANISTTWLNILLRLHLWPINLVFS